MGEIKRSGRVFRDGVSQLRHRVRLMEWVFRTLNPGPPTLDFVTVGHLYIPKDDARQAVGLNGGNFGTNILVHYD